mmetsp:Transcript_4410/g.10397  ORF Transcript_4410/g.10397 Transcript_4410/m.10397 type:complete len:199 (+) Transcript_4410:1261-1857(+)
MFRLGLAPQMLSRVLNLLCTVLREADIAENLPNIIISAIEKCNLSPTVKEFKHFRQQVQAWFQHRKKKSHGKPFKWSGSGREVALFFLNTPLWLEAVLAGIGSLTLKLRNPGTGVTSDTVSATIQRVHGHVLVAGERHFKVAGPEMDMKDRDPVLRPAQEVFGMDRYWQGHQPGASRHCLWSRAAAGVQMAGLRQVDC